VAEILADGDNPILVGFVRQHFLDRDNIAAVLFIGGDTLRKTAALPRRHRHHVGQQNREGLIANNVARAPDRMAEAERHLLAGETRRAGAGESSFRAAIP